jgi:DNA-binding response OmpR family regulator
MDEPKSTQTRKVLLASADTMMLDRVSRVLREAGHAVVSTQRSGRLLYRVLEDPFDLVIMDIDVEGLSGLEALQILRRAKPELPVVVLAGALREREERQLAVEGVAGILRKPIDVTDLVDAVRIADRTEGGDGEGERGTL